MNKLLLRIFMCALSFGASISAMSDEYSYYTEEEVGPATAAALKALADGASKLSGQIGTARGAASRQGRALAGARKNLNEGTRLTEEIDRDLEAAASDLEDVRDHQDDANAQVTEAIKKRKKCGCCGKCCCGCGKCVIL